MLSWLFGCAGECSACKHAHLSARYPVVELVTGGALRVLRMAFRFGPPAALGALLFAWALIALAFIDFDTHLPARTTSRCRCCGPA